MSDFRDKSYSNLGYNGLFALGYSAASAGYNYLFPSYKTNNNTMDIGDEIVTAYKSYRGAKSFLRDIGFGDQSAGIATRNVGHISSGRKKWSLRKLLNGTVVTQTQNLGIKNWTDQNWVYKYLVSEHNLNAGFTSIGKATSMTSAELPMHVYDLSFVVGSSPDNKTNYADTSTTQNSNINARAWYLKTDSTFAPLNDVGNTRQPRWMIDRPDNTQLPVDDPTKIYMNSIDIKYQLFGTQKMPMEYDIMVIRITDPIMCPDYPNNLQDVSATDNQSLKDFKTGWSKLIYPWTVSPIMRGMDEPGPMNMRKWFNVVAKKRVKVGERTQLDTVPRVSGSIHVNVNELHDHTWSSKNFNAPGEGRGAGDFYDNPATVVDDSVNAQWQNKPYYTSRFYLVIRALGTVDTAAAQAGGEDPNSVLAPFDDYEAPIQGGAEPIYNVDTPVFIGAAHLPRFISTGTTACEYNGSYDLIIRTKYSKVNGV